MKKILLSLFVITSFAAYSIYQRASGHFELATPLDTDKKNAPTAPITAITSPSSANSTTAEISAKPAPLRSNNRLSKPNDENDDENEYENKDDEGRVRGRVTTANPTPAAAPKTQTVSQTPTPAPTPTQTAGQISSQTSATQTTTAPAPKGQFKDGEYTGPVVDAYYGNVQVKAVIQNGKLTDVVFLDYPQDRSTSVKINTGAMPMLKSEAIQAQSGQVDGVSGATQTSIAFRESLSAALTQAKI